MLRRNRKIITCLTFLIISVLFSITANAETLSGSCGDEATYVIENNVLTISGTGVVDNDEGWFDYYDVIEKVVITEGIEELDASLFADFEVLSSVILPETLTTIGSRTFSGCIALEKIVIPDSVTSINRASFRNCDNLVIYCSSGSYAEDFAVNNDYAYVIIKDATVKFDANGGVGAPTSLTASILEKFTVPNTIPTREGSVFMGWASTSQASDVEYYIGDSFNVDTDTTLYAVWLQCTITSDTTETNICINATTESPVLDLYEAAYLNGELIDVVVKEVKLNAGVNNIAMDVNWNSVDKDEIKVFLWDKDLNIYAYPHNIPIQEKHTVTFVDWNNEIISTQMILPGGTATLPAEPSREGYEFCGWSCSGENIVQDTTIVAQYIDATKENIFKVSNVQGKVGDIVTTSIYLDGIVKTCGFDMRLLYDTNTLELVSIDNDWNLDIVAGSVPEDGIIKFNYGSSKNRTKKAKIMEVSFKIKDTNLSETTLGIQPIEVVAADEAQDNVPVKIAHTLIEGVVTIK